LLSHGHGEPIMSHPDYEQCAHHHGSLLVLVRGIGQLKPRSLQKVFERIQRVNNVQVTDSTGLTRDIWVRYIRDHPVENNDWGDFQTHRRLLGLITVGKFDTQLELNELCRVHESLKVKYTNTLYDSMAILYGPTRDARLASNGNLSQLSVGSQQSQTNSKSNMAPDSSLSDKETSLNSLSDSVTNSSGVISLNSDILASMENQVNQLKLEEQFQTPSNFKSRALFYPENDPSVNLETNVTEFINSLFWILESKRLERTKEKIDRVALLLAPFEKKDFVGLDMESRNNKKRCIGRVTKHLGDLTLQAGLVAESLNLFHAASETLRAISDSLWLGAANEGLCAASAILLYPSLRNTMSFHRNSSLPDGTSPQKLRVATSSMQQDMKNTRNRKSGLAINLASSGSSSSPASSVASSLSSGTSGSGADNSTSSNDTETQKGLPLPPKSTAQNLYPSNILTPDEITTRYRDAIINYSKYRNAGIIETEAALKAARICIEQQQNLDVAMFLQNVLYINLTMNEQERVRRFEMLTDLYQQIGYNRKAAFCQRLAAWRHVAQSNTNPDWGQSYRLMLESFSGHKLALEPTEVILNNTGWPVLQIDLLQQLVAAARRLGQSALATRHMTFLLQTMWKHLSNNERGEMALQLQNLSAQCEGEWRGSNFAS
jgi:trafficking protein particle complex subunit 9